MVNWLIAFHGATITLSFAYFFRFRKVDTNFFKKSHDFIIDVKNRTTGELAQEISGTMESGIRIIAISEGSEVTYSEEEVNPLKGEKFKNWLDNYLEKERSFFVLYHSFKEIYAKWKKWYAAVTVYSKILIFTQFLNLAFCAISEHTPFFGTKEKNIELMYGSGVLGLILVLVGILMIFRVDSIKDHLVSKMDEYHEL